MDNNINYYDKLIEWREQDRKRKEEGLLVIKHDELPLENNPQGLMRWYMHPAMENVSMRSMNVYIQDIKPGSYSGKMKVQGGIVNFIWQGEGYSILDGEKIEWKKDDVLQIPNRPDGVVVQHFSTDKENTTKIIVVEANLIDTIGVDRGAGFEQLQNAPEYKR